MDHPYKHLDETKFWRTGVADLAPGGRYRQIWMPRFAIDRNTRILTAGSCFAQHVGAWLREHGYRWIGTKAGGAESDFSFATGNIYTAALLRQWVEAALDRCDLAGTHHAKAGHGHVHDLLRPSIAPDGFSGWQDFADSRAAALKEIRENIRSGDLFVFTLGLTEAWVDQDGIVYPVCPGVLAGEFDPERYTFRNYGFEEVVADMLATIDLVRSVNPNMRFLLTVSPVPLTATASADHVLPATVYSKSVLRAAAGHLAAGHEAVDYFPSYEIVTSPASGGALFEKNLRTVRREGVAFVMAHFEAGLAGETEAKQTGAPSQQRPSSVPAPRKADDDVVCEEVFLDSWQDREAEVAHPRFCLIGDSHMGKLSLAMGRIGIPHIGGMIMSGTSWTSNLLHLDEAEHFVPLEGKAARTVWRDTQEALEAAVNTGERPVLLVNPGLQTHRNVMLFVHWVREKFPAEAPSQQRLIEYFRTVLATQMALLGRLAKAGHRVVVVSDPPFSAHFEEVKLDESFFRVYENTMESIARTLGCEFFSARRWIADERGFQEEFLTDAVYEDGSHDWYHGSDLYYEELARKLSAVYAPAEPPRTASADAVA